MIPDTAPSARPVLSAVSGGAGTSVRPGFVDRRGIRSAVAGVAMGLLAALVGSSASAQTAPVQATRGQESPAPAVELPRDPRPLLVGLQMQRDDRAALDLAQRWMERDPEAAAAAGVTYLQGRLYERLERPEEARAAYARTLVDSPDFAPWSRLRLALEQEELGHPEVAAGLVARVVAERPPKALAPRATSLLARSILAGGDCRVLGGLTGEGLSKTSRRRLDVVRSDCDLRAGRLQAARQRLERLLREDGDDAVSLDVAHRLRRRLDRGTASTEWLLRVGMTLYHHREFEPALELLAAGLGRDDARRATVAVGSIDEVRYAIARSLFWLERYPMAARAFAGVASTVSGAEEKARALYQRGRSLELMGPEIWPRAIDAFDEVVVAQPAGSWSASAQLSRLRLMWRLGREDEALAELRRLTQRRRSYAINRSLLFLIASDLSQGRGDRAGDWLDQATRLDEAPAIELDYWRGRHAEIVSTPRAAVDRYLSAVAADPFHPYGVAARRRLASATLREAALGRARELVAQGSATSLYRAWLVLDGEPAGDAVRQRLEAVLAKSSSARRFLELEAVPIEAWSLFSGALARPEDRLLALGLFDDGSPAVSRHFPMQRTDLAFTGSRALALSGATHRSLYVAEVLSQRVPQSLPRAAWPESFRKLLYPFRYGYLVLRESSRRGIDPHLLAAIIREESRYDPDAFSGAAARGLTQFVVPTAQRIGESIGLGRIEPRQLHQPEVAIALGAAYLGELSGHFEGSEPAMVTAYNAGERQSELWRAYCFTDQPEEYMAKIAFRETRGYLHKVLTSRAHYRALYERTAR